MSTNTITIKDLEKMSYDEIMDVLKNHYDDIETVYFCYWDGKNISVNSTYSELAFTSVICKRFETERVAEQLEAQGFGEIYGDNYGFIHAEKIYFY